MRSFLFGAAAVMLLGVAASVSLPAQVRLPPGVPILNAPPLPGGTGAILGRVIDAISGLPVPSALVTVEAFTIAGPPSSLTDGRGYFVLRGLPAGRFTLTVRAAGYLFGGYGQRTPAGSSQSLLLGDGEVVANADIRLWRSAAITGGLYDERGEPVVGVGVSGYRREVVGGRLLLSNTVYATTNDRGIFRLRDLVPGEYIVGMTTWIQSIPTSIAEEYVQALQSNDPGARGRLEAIARGGANVGAVGGVTVGDQQVRADRGLVPVLIDGAFGVYSTTFSPSADSPVDAIVVRVGSGDEKSGIDILTKPVATRTVSGVVAGPSGPLAGASVRIENSYARDLLAGSRFVVAATSTDANGRFTLVGLTPGNYVVRASLTLTDAPPATIRAGDGTPMLAPGGAAATGGFIAGTEEPRGNLTGSTTIEVGSRNVTDVAVALEPGVGFSGHVYAAAFDSNARPPLLTSVGLRLSPQDAGGDSVPFRPLASGEFVLPAVPKGRYVIDISSLPVRWNVGAIRAGNRDVSGRAFDINADVNDVEIVLVDRLPEVSGSVSRGPGKDKIDATVAIFPADVKEWLGSGMVARRARQVSTGPDGSFEISNLLPGDYSVVAVDAGRRIELRDPADLERLSRAATQVTLRPGERRTLSLRLAALP